MVETQLLLCLTTDIGELPTAEVASRRKSLVPSMIKGVIWFRAFELGILSVYYIVEGLDESQSWRRTSALIL